jgi:hypothetical protein
MRLRFVASFVRPSKDPASTAASISTFSRVLRDTEVHRARLAGHRHLSVPALLAPVNRPCFLFARRGSTQ